MNLLIFWIISSNLLFSVQSAPHEEESFETIINETLAEEGATIEGDIFQDAFVFNVKPAFGEERKVHVVGSEIFQALLVNVEKTEKSSEENFVVDFKNSYTLVSDEDVCVITRINDYLSYKDEVNNLKSVKSTLTLDSASCQFRFIEKSSLSQYDGIADYLCSSNATTTIIELLECNTASADDFDQSVPMEVFAKISKNCNGIMYLCNEVEDCALVCVTHVYESKFSFEDEFTVVKTEGDSGVLRGGTDEEFVFAVANLGGDSTKYYLGTTYLDINNGLSVSFNYFDDLCAVTKLPEGKTFKSLFIDFSKDVANVAPVVQCSSDQNLDSEKFQKSELFKEVCKDSETFHIDDCKLVAEEDLPEELQCKFLTLMYVEDEASLYCVIENNL